MTKSELDKTISSKLWGIHRQVLANQGKYDVLDWDKSLIQHWI